MLRGHMDAAAHRATRFPDLALFAQREDAAMTRRARNNKAAAKKAIESYDHQDKKRANNPPVGLVTPRTDPDVAHKKTYQHAPHLDPQLVWPGKAPE